MRGALLASALILLMACDERPPSTLPAASMNVGATEGDAQRTSADAHESRDDVRAGSRGTELINPDSNAVVLLYYALADLEPPFAEWVEQDNRVLFAEPIDKAAQRAAVRAELESAAKAVRGIDRLQLSMNARLSQYDPTYGEFSVGAFAPSSVVTFDAFRQKVSLKFGNAKQAYIWRVPAAEAQAIRDKIGYGHVALNAILQITGVQPGTGGGTLIADVIEYEMRESTRDLLIGRVQVAKR